MNWPLAKRLVGETTGYQKKYITTFFKVKFSASVIVILQGMERPVYLMCTARAGFHNIFQKREEGLVFDH